MKRWQGSCIGGASLVFLVPFGGAMITAMPPVLDRRTAYVLCPDAIDYSYNDFGFGTPATSSPSGGAGHYTELTCTYADGSQKVFGNEEVGVKGLTASFIAAGICCGLAVVLLVIVAALIGARLVKPKETQS